MTDESAVVDAYTNLKTRAEEGAGYNEDNWGNTTNPEANQACPNGNPFVLLGEDSQSRPLKWWINYHWTKGSGTYAWGDGWLRSNFDPKQFFIQNGKEVTLRAFGPAQDKCITSELVSERLVGKGSYVVTARVDSGTRSFAQLDPNVIFGLFSYQWGQADPNETPNIHREYDLLETVSTTWAQGPDRNSGNAQFTVQPWNKNQWHNITRFSVPDTQYLTAWLDWSSNPPVYRLYKGNFPYEAIKYPGPLPFQEWTVPVGYTFKPNIGAPRFHINLYLAQGKPPQAEQRVTITRVQMVP
jgi:hypothetical protein